MFVKCEKPKLFPHDPFPAVECHSNNQPKWWTKHTHETKTPPTLHICSFLSFSCFLNFLSKSPGCVITIFFISSCLIYSFLCKFIIQLFYFLNTVPFYIFFCYVLHSFYFVVSLSSAHIGRKLVNKINWLIHKQYDLKKPYFCSSVHSISFFRV